MLKKLYEISVEVDKLHNQYNRSPTNENKQKLEEKRQELYEAMEGKK